MHLPVEECTHEKPSVEEFAATSTVLECHHAAQGARMGG